MPGSQGTGRAGVECSIGFRREIDPVSKTLDIAVRDCDPFVRLQGKWIVRRLAPDCSKIDPGMFPRRRDESKLLRAMGWETANLHLGSLLTAEVLADISKRRGHWLHKAAAKMVAATRTDWEEWQSTIA